MYSKVVENFLCLVADVKSRSLCVRMCESGIYMYIYI